MSGPEKKYVYWSPDDWLIFPDTLNHAVVARTHHPREMPLSAGFVRQRPDCSIELYGESESLGLKADKEHERIINAIFCRSAA